MSVPQPGDLIRAARLDIGWSTAALATAAGLTPGALRALEQGGAVPSAALLRHVLAAARTRPSIPLAFHVTLAGSRTPSRN
ncbi:helix-turn-helix domain-containing protein [Curtobacterium sp. 22159]|uniref:helix-turn-helix domain-containing protein n=1 Tax=Curtobacterium sp. 22159 TaxID=3453882 RepID=UPI003F8523FB